jgi:hypothetical protein
MFVAAKHRPARSGETIVNETGKSADQLEQHGHPVDIDAGRADALQDCARAMARDSGRVTCAGATVEQAVR